MRILDAIVDAFFQRCCCYASKTPVFLLAVNSLSETLEILHVAEAARDQKGWLSDAQSWEDANKTAELRGYALSSDGADGKPRRAIRRKRFPDEGAGGSEKENDTPGDDDSDSSARTHLVMKKPRAIQQAKKPKMKKPTGTLAWN